MAVETNPKWDEYILWLATPEHERGLVANEDQWAKANGFADARTTRRWRKNPDFVARQKTLLNGIVAKQGAITVHNTEQGAIDADELDYKVVKSKLVESAKSGNLKAQEMFLKTYGKSWIDEEQSSRSSDYTNLELADLVAKSITFLSPDIMIKHLTELGYKIERI